MTVDILPTILIMKNDHEFFDLCRKVRFEVFVDEQKVPAENEMDEMDDCSFHFLYLCPKSNASTQKPQIISLLNTNTNLLNHNTIVDQYEPACTLRIFQKDKIWKLGRMACRIQYRGKGIASLLMKSSEGFLKEEYGNVSVHLHAQLDKRQFYEKNGYIVENEEIFYEENIPHVHMIKSINI